MRELIRDSLWNAICLGALVVTYSNSEALAQNIPTPGSSCAGYSWCNNGAGGGSTNNRRNQYDPYRARVERENQAIDQYNAGQAANRAKNYPLAEFYYRRALEIWPGDELAQKELLVVQGLDAYNHRNFALALSFYQQVLQIDPDDPYAAGHIAKARAGMAMAQGQAAWNQGDMPAALAYYQQAYALDPYQGYLDEINKIKSDLQAQQFQQQDAARRQQIRQSMSAITPALSADRNHANAQPSSLDFKTGDDGLTVNGTTTGAFGEPVAVTTAVSPKKVTSGSDDKAGDQLLAVARDAASGSTLTPDYDRGGVSAAGSLNWSRPAQTPGTASLIGHIGDRGMHDPEIQQNVRYYQALDEGKIDAQAQTATLQQQLAKGEGDAQVLGLQLAQLNTDIANYKRLQGDVQKQIQKKMESIGVSWIDSPAPKKGAPSAGTGASQ